METHKILFESLDKAEQYFEAGEIRNGQKLVNEVSRSIRSEGKVSNKYGRRNIAVIGLIGYSVSIIALITPLFLVEKNVLDLAYLLPLLVLGRLINGLIGSATRGACYRPCYCRDRENR